MHQLRTISFPTISLPYILIYHGSGSFFYSLWTLFSASFTSTIWTDQHPSHNFSTQIFFRTLHFEPAAGSLHVLWWNQPMDTFTRLWSNYHRIWVRTSCGGSQTAMRPHRRGAHPRAVSITWHIFLCFHLSHIIVSVLALHCAFSALIPTRSFYEESDPVSLKATIYNLPLLRKTF